ncbi:MAG: hypothetical protein OER88_03330, partial [Planctomycetota bacterium]|nr:hypothetical protein [Planctomycetota bacterium]
MERARLALARLLDCEVGPVNVELRDAGRNPDGAWAVARGDTITVFTEHLLLKRYDLDRLLLHEMFHVVHRRAVGSTAYLATPTWMREGAALFVAGQVPHRLDVLAAHAGA